MQADDFRERTMEFSLRVLEVVDALPRSTKGRNIADQLCRSGTSVAANYRAACRAKSRADFISKMGTVEEEADEAIFWLDLIGRAKVLLSACLAPLIAEASEILSVVIASINTARRNRG